MTLVLPSRDRSHLLPATAAVSHGQEGLYTRSCIRKMVRIGGPLFPDEGRSLQDSSCYPQSSKKSAGMYRMMRGSPAAPKSSPPALPSARSSQGRQRRIGYRHILNAIMLKLSFPAIKEKVHVGPTAVNIQEDFVRC